MGDASDHPLILSGDQEVPFTYMASLSAKWAKMKEEAPAIRGKIKVKDKLSTVLFWAVIFTLCTSYSSYFN